MKTTKFFALAFLLCPSVLFAASSNDNEILLDQSGDTLTLTIDQIGYGNKLGGTIANGVVATDWIFTGSNNTFDIDMIGNLNQIFGPTLLDSSDVDLSITGDSNIWDWNIGYGGSADTSVLDIAISGDGNTMDFDWSYFASAERLDFDLIIAGDSNVWDVDIDADDVTFNIDVLGGSNNFKIDQKDGSYTSLTMEYVGSNGDIDIMQQSGTCPNGVNSCYGLINADFDSENATINIVQKDTTD
jgi:hypothetical protein